MKKLFVANWKMKPETLKEALALTKVSDRKGVVIAPPSLFALSVASSLSHATLAAQDVFEENPARGGAFTGAVSASMVRRAGARYVIVGHSERRAFAHETDAEIAEKIRVVQKEGMKPILCIGEKLSIRRKGVRAVEKHLLAALKKDAHASSKNELIVAYEPLWAIGTGVHAAPSDAAAMSRFIKGAMKAMFGMKKTVVLYGGSVDSTNIGAFAEERDIDGFLVGGASTRPEECKKMLSILSL